MTVACTRPVLFEALLIESPKHRSGADMLINRRNVGHVGEGRASNPRGALIDHSYKVSGNSSLTAPPRQWFLETSFRF